MQSCRSVFVYGTLRSGQAFRPSVERWVASCRPATIRARMYHFAPDGSRGEWPFIVPGDDMITGEVLTFTDFDAALAALDEIEDYPDLYLREVVRVTYEDGAEGHAWAYWIRPGQEQWGRAIQSGDWVLDQMPNGEDL